MTGKGEPVTASRKIPSITMAMISLMMLRDREPTFLLAYSKLSAVRVQETATMSEMISPKCWFIF